MKKQSCFRIFGALIILVIVFCAFGHPMISLHNGRLKQAILATEGQESIPLFLLIGTPYIPLIPTPAKKKYKKPLVARVLPFGKRLAKEWSS